MALTETSEALRGDPQTHLPGVDAEEEAEAYGASQWQLVWWKFRKHRMAMTAGLVIIGLYIVAVFCEFLAPYTLEYRQVKYAFAPPQRLHLVSDEGIHLWPFVYGIRGVRHPEVPITITGIHRCPNKSKTFANDQAAL